MNVHHLELFYFVAKYEGITLAVRKMPYGIQQPAVSGQMLQLEKSLGIKLFHRRPFSLTPAGKELYDFIYPFFSGLDHMAERLCGGESQHLRLTASAAALTNHLPDVLRLLRNEFPDLRLSLREMSGTDIEAALQKQDADVAVSTIQAKPAPSIKTVKLIDLPLAILVPGDSKMKTFREIIAKSTDGKITHPLISLPRNEPVSMLFQEGLAERNLNWEPSMEVSELGLIENYVSSGFGFGVTVDIPGKKWSAEIRTIKLPGSFPPLSIGAMHTGSLKAVAQRFIDLAKAYSAELKKQS